MARVRFGGTNSDFALAKDAANNLQLAPTSLTFWSAATGGTQYTDLLLSSAAVASINSDANGQIPVFYGPNGITEMWADAGAASRVLIVGNDPDATAAVKLGTPGSALGQATESLVGTRIGQSGTGIDTALKVREPGLNAKHPDFGGLAGNGTTDDYATLQAAFNAACAQGKPLWIPKPSVAYKITQALTGTDGLWVQGPGEAQVIIKGNLAGPLIKSANTATRYFRWNLSGFMLDNTSRSTSGGIGLDITNISLSYFNVGIQNAQTAIRATEAAYYNEIHARISGAVTGVKVGGGTVSTNECDWFVRINDVTDGVIIDNATNHTFYKPAIELFTGIGFKIAQTAATQYINLLTPRFENTGGVGTGVRNYSLAQATSWFGGMTGGIATDFVNDAAAKELMVARPGSYSPEYRAAQVTYAGGYVTWVDSTGKLRIKQGQPTSDTDGTVVGTQT